MSFVLGPIFSSVSEKWNYLVYELADERSRDWFMTGSPVPLILLIVAYYQFVRIIGPAFMDHRKPYNIDRIIQIYNLIQVVVCGWIFLESVMITYGPYGAYNWRCQPIDKSMSPVGIRVVSLTWMYYMLKIFDLLDTVFFILRKKNNQVSFLHLYHHIGVLILGFIGCRYYPDGQGFILVPTNSLVHCFMYSYYFLTNYYPEKKKNLWWKKHITQIQIAQLFFLIFQIGKVLLMPDCDYPSLPVYLFLPQNVYLMLLFCKFYYESYIKTKKPSKTT